MWFFPRLRSPKRSDPRERLRAHSPPRQRATFRPLVEALEDRWLPSQIGLTVNSLADTAPGTPPAPGTLRAAILAANAGSHSDKFTIGFSVTGTIDLQSPLPDLNNSIAIQGPGGSSLTVQRDPAVPFSSAIITVDAGQTASLSGLTIANGSAGGIANNGTLTVSGCSLSGNFGCGILIFQGMVAVMGSTFTGNSAVPGNAGGGIFNRAGELTVADSTFSGNSAPDLTLSNGIVLVFGDGGGIYNGGTATVTDCTLSGNSAGFGGGIDNDGTLVVRGCTLWGNSAVDSGGGLFNSGTITVQQTTVCGNTAAAGGGGTFFDSGGGIFNRGTATIQDCTVSGNTAGSAGGGIFNAASGALTVDDSTVCGNVAPLGADLYNLGLATIHDSDVCVIGP